LFTSVNLPIVYPAKHLTTKLHNFLSLHAKTI
jgi:hypothetical protein